MVERARLFDLACLGLLVAGLAAIFVPLYYALVVASQTDDTVRLSLAALPGPALFDNLAAAWNKADLQRQLFNSAVMALGITIGKLAISLLSAFAITYFQFRFRMVAFWGIFLTLMLPVEVRIVPTFQVAANVASPLNAVLSLGGWQAGLNLSLLDSYGGLILPLIASATATFLFRQFFLTVPDELAEAARVDGAGPIRFFLDILLPMSRTNIAALFVILFIYGWNQYLWPLLITTKPEMNTIVMGIKQMFPSGDDIADWPVIMATTLMAMLPPVAVVVFMQRLFVKGLVESEK